MELLKNNDRNQLRHQDFYTSYMALTDIEIYDYNIRYFDEEFIIKLFTKIKTQKLATSMNYRLHSDYILFSVDPNKIEKRSFSTYKEYLSYCVDNHVGNIPDDNDVGNKVAMNKSDIMINKVKTALNLKTTQKSTVYEICASLGKKTYEVYICKQDCLVMYISRKNYLKYQNLAAKAFTVKREFFTTVFSPIENFEKMYCKLINALHIQLMSKNHSLFNLYDDIQYIYIIKKGEIELSYKKDDDDKRLTPILRCTRGSLVGEFEVINGKPHRYIKGTVLSSECIVYCIQVEYFKLLLNLSKQFRKKIISQSKEKYKKVADWSSNESDFARSYTHKKLPITELRGSLLNVHKLSILGCQNKTNQQQDLILSNNNLLHLKTLHKITEEKAPTQLKLKRYLKQNNSTSKFTIKSNKLDNSAKNLITKRYKNFSLSNYIECTTKYVKNHSESNKRRNPFTQKVPDDFYLNDKKGLKVDKTILKAKLPSVKNKPDSYKFFTEYLKNRLTDYNSYYNTATNSNHLSTQQHEYITNVRKRLEKSLGRSLLIQN